MESSLTAIGFSKLDEDYTIEDLLGNILNESNRKKALQIEEQNVLVEYAQEVSENTYIMARVGLNELDQDAKIEVYDCEPCVVSRTELEISSIDIEGIEEANAYYAICEEKETTMQIIFWMQNVVDYLSAKKKGQVCKKINIAAIAVEGTIILPIERDEEEEQLEKEERDKIRDVIQKMKDGDEDARHFLEKEEKEMDQQLKERLYEEDFLTIMSGYFIPATLQEATYAVLGLIKDVEKRKNKETQEEMYVLTLDINDLEVETVINADKLVGLPSIGMRFMGTCWLQGRVIMG